MITLNKVFLVGNLARDPDLRHTPSGTSVTEFRLAVSDSYTTSTGEKHERTCFIDVVSWRKLAESCAEYLKKGSPVFVEGRLEQDTWETPDGQKRSRIRVVAYSVQFIRREVERSASGRHAKWWNRAARRLRMRPAAAILHRRPMTQADAQVWKTLVMWFRNKTVNGSTKESIPGPGPKNIRGRTCGAHPWVPQPEVVSPKESEEKEEEEEGSPARAGSEQAGQGPEAFH